MSGIFAIVMVDIGYMIYSVRRSYFEAVEEAERLHTDDIESYIKWMRYVHPILLVWFIVGFATPFLPHIILIPYIIGGVILFIWLVFAYYKLLIDMEVSSSSSALNTLRTGCITSPPRGSGPTDNILNYMIPELLHARERALIERRGVNIKSDMGWRLDMLSESIDAWVTAKEYLKADLTIDQMARDLGQIVLTSQRISTIGIR